MKLLSRNDELMLLAVWRLQSDAYAVTVRDEVQRMTGKQWSFGSIFVTLDRLSRKGHLKSRLGDPTPERGGKRKRFYELSASGRRARIEIRRLEETIWEGVSEQALKRATS